ncbi:MAG: carbohydrate porin, partial [Verrucomicrobia bacterium]|nr:carbohydrate porin [Verrucomicrobiota bacterium]
LGNENDIYMELSWQQNHILGDSPDVADVSFRVTLAIFYNLNRATFNTTAINTSGDAGFTMREAYAEMKNVFKSAPEITFWGGERFYDRWNVDSNDYFYLDDSGYGAGVHDIDLGFGKLWLAYFGGQNDLFVSNKVGAFYKHTFDARIKGIDLGGFGKLELVLIGNYEVGSQFEFGDANSSTPTTQNGTAFEGIRSDGAWGIGGGIVYQLDLPNKGFWQIWALFGTGATNFSSTDDSGAGSLGPGPGGTLVGFAENSPAANGSVFRNDQGALIVNAKDVINKRHEYRAGTYLVMNPIPQFSFGTWVFWNQNDLGYSLPHADSTRNLVEAGIRPVWWVFDNFALQGQAWVGWEDNNRTTGVGAGRSGTMGVFTIAPTIKPKGGYFTRPEIRLFATWGVWSKSLKGSAANGDPPYSGSVTNGGGNPDLTGGKNSTNGWLFGTQMEIWW